jgi:ABC-type uncharacterized transport system permease subunit
VIHFTFDAARKGPPRISASGVSGETSSRGRWTHLLAGSLAHIVAAIGALLAGAVILRAFGAAPLSAYEAMFRGAFGSVDSITATILKALPLVLVGVGITIAFRANVLNIGGEGQMVMGGLAGTPGNGTTLIEWFFVIA